MIRFLLDDGNRWRGRSRFLAVVGFARKKPTEGGLLASRHRSPALVWALFLRPPRESYRLVGSDQQEEQEQQQLTTYKTRLAFVVVVAFAFFFFFFHSPVRCFDLFFFAFDCFLAVAGARERRNKKTETFFFLSKNATTTLQD